MITGGRAETAGVVRRRHVADAGASGEAFGIWDLGFQISDFRFHVWTRRQAGRCGARGGSQSSFPPIEVAGRHAVQQA